jgi:hypothetical protein
MKPREGERESSPSSQLTIKKNQGMSDNNQTQIHVTGEATGLIPSPGNHGKPITVIGTAATRSAAGRTPRGTTTGHSCRRHGQLPG